VQLTNYQLLCDCSFSYRNENEGLLEVTGAIEVQYRSADISKTIQCVGAAKFGSMTQIITS